MSPNKGYRQTEEHVKNLSKAMRGNTNSTGRILSTKHKDNISKAMVGRKFSDAHKQKLKEAWAKRRVQK